MGPKSVVRDYYHRIRQNTLDIVAPLTAEDMNLQMMPKVSPPKWHLAHTTWFFEKLILSGAQEGYEVFCEPYHDLFNSYYQSLGRPFARDQRGALSRPFLKDVLRYRQYVDEAMAELMAADPKEEVWEAMALGLAHEEQHQELLYMDLLYNFSRNPLHPVYQEDYPELADEEKGSFMDIKPDVYSIGTDDKDAYDCEGPRHRVFLEPVALSSSLVSNGDYLEFMQSKGYERSEFWLAKGFDWVQRDEIKAPLYWRFIDGDWYEYHLGGLKPLQMSQPVRHVSFFEADAYARFAGARLPKEAEWEVFARLYSKFCPLDRLWQWTLSSYEPYPGFKKRPGAFSEYNGKFMCDQYVLRGGAKETPKGHTRLSYRNYFEAQDRWPFTGIRLARDLV